MASKHIIQIKFSLLIAMATFSLNSFAEQWQKHHFTSMNGYYFRLDVKKNSEYRPYGDVAEELWINFYKNIDGQNLTAQNKIRAVVLDYCDDRSNQPSFMMTKDLQFVEDEGGKFTGKLDYELPINIRRMSYYQECRQEIAIVIDGQWLPYANGINNFPFNLSK